MCAANTRSRRKFRGKTLGKTELCLLAALTAEVVQAARASELVGYGGSNRDMVDKLTFGVYAFLGKIKCYLVLLSAKSARMA